MSVIFRKEKSVFKLKSSKGLLSFLIFPTVLSAMIGCNYNRKYYEFQPTIYDRGLLRIGTSTSQANGMSMDNKGTSTANINGMTVEYTDKYINIKNFDISIPYGGQAVKITDADVLGFTDGVKKILQKRSNLARRVRMTSGTGQILAAAAGATLGLIAHANVETVAALAAVSAVIPELQTIWDARGRAETYNKGLNLIQEAESRYFEKRTAAGPLTQGISSEELTPEGVQLLKEVTACIQVVGTALVELIPTVDELLMAHGRLKDELEQIKVAPEAVSLNFDKEKDVYILYGKVITYSIDGVNIIKIEPEKFEQERDCFTIKGIGSGTAKVTVFNSHGKSKSINVTVVKKIPVADAGVQQLVEVGKSVVLDGSQSFDPENKKFTYLWSLQDPSGYKAEFKEADNTKNAKPEFTATKPGVYLVGLKIKNEDNVESNPVNVKVVANYKPVARIKKPAATVTVGSNVELDGSGSFDKDYTDNRELKEYKWTITFPKGNTESHTGPKVTFSPIEIGAHTVSLVVRDEYEDSVPDNCTITAEYEKPIANAGDDKVAKVGEIVTLDGSMSKPNSGTLICKWEIVEQPAGSGLTIEKPEDPKLSIKLEKVGDYIFKLTVNDGHSASEPDEVKIIVK